MLLSKAFAPLPEPGFSPPATAEELAAAAGLTRSLAAGVYAALPIGTRVLERLHSIIARELAAIGAVELTLPTLEPASLTERSARLGRFSRSIVTVEVDRRSMCLNPSSEELVTELMLRSGALSRRSLPLLVASRNRLFRVGGHTHGLHRATEFPVDEVYGFAADEEELANLIAMVRRAWQRALERCSIGHAYVQDGGAGAASFNYYAFTTATHNQRLLRCAECGRTGELLGGAAPLCASCGAVGDAIGVLRVAQVRDLGTSYSGAAGLHTTDAHGKRREVVMCGGGVSLYLLLVACLEQHRDAHGIVWPARLAPFDALVTTLGEDEGVLDAGSTIYRQLQHAGIEVAWDERRGSASSKLAAADLVGVPARVVLGRRGVAAGTAEFSACGTHGHSPIAIADVQRAVEVALRDCRDTVA